MDDFQSFFHENPDKLRLAISSIKTVHANRRALKDYGFSNLTELIEASSGTLWLEELDYYSEEFSRLANGEVRCGIESPIQWPDGSEHIIRDVMFIPEQYREDWSCIISTEEDITDLKKAERELRELNQNLEARINKQTRSLRESEQRYKDITDAASDWFWETDTDLRYTFVSDHFFEETGLEPQNFIGKTRMEFVGEDNIAKNPELWRAHEEDLKLRKPFRNFEYFQDDKDGKRRYVRVSAQPFFNDNGEFLGYRGAARDITKRKLAEEKIRASEERYYQVLKNLADGVVVIDPKGEINFVNPEILGIFGYSRDELIGQNVRMLMPEPDRSNHDSYIEKYFETGIPKIIGLGREVTGLRKDGSIVCLGLTIMELNMPEGKAFLGTVRDLTQQKRIEGALVQSQQEAISANKAKSDFLSSMSHELRTPMNAILGFAQMLQYNPKEPLTETQSSSVDLILKGGSHLLELIDQVLELSRIEAGHIPLSVDHYSAGEIIDGSLDLIRSRADRDGIKIVDQIVRDDLPLLWTDSTRLMQVLLNLLSNAVKYNSKNGTVTLTCKETPKRMLRISVADTGSGIPAKTQADLFKPFERLGRESGKIEGTGIGLTITRQITELLGGRIGFESEEGKGSTFWVEIPVSEKQEHDEANVKTSALTGMTIKERDETGSQYTVLYVEDNPANVKLMEMMIGQIGNAKLLTAFDAEHGLDLANSEIPDLIVMDINLPGMDGNKALKQLQDTVETKDIPVIALTSASMPSAVEAGLKAGYRDYITKPINVPKFIQTIEETLGSIKKHT